MDYYEELGIDPAADQEEIHRAHRRLTKLLHPDQQTDRAMKLLAETQMRRLNAIVEVLSNPEQRRLYDEALNGSGLLSNSPPAQPRPPEAAVRRRFTWPALPWWIGSTIAAVVLTVGVVWFWADNLGSSLGDRNAVYVPSAAQESGSEIKSTDTNANPTSIRKDRPSALARLRAALLPPQPPAKSNHSTKQAKLKNPDSRSSQARNTGAGNSNAPFVVVVPTPAPANSSTESSSNNVPLVAEDTRPAESSLPSATKYDPAVPKKVEISPPPKVPANTAVRGETPSIPLPPLPVAAAPKPSAAISQPKVTAQPATVRSPTPAAEPIHQHPLEGEWVYAPKQPEKRKPGLYPPEFIDLKLTWNGNAIEGQYHARYAVTGKPISPDVNFVLSAADKDARKFTWQGGNGNRGTLKISSIDPNSIKVEWRTTVFSPFPALTSGTATLVRRTNQ